MDELQQQPQTKKAKAKAKQDGRSTKRSASGATPATTKKLESQQSPIPTGVVADRACAEVAVAAMAVMGAEVVAPTAISAVAATMTVPSQAPLSSPSSTTVAATFVPHFLFPQPIRADNHPYVLRNVGSIVVGGLLLGC